jgi:hypothetical protein
MKNKLDQMDLVSIRNLFLTEMKNFLIALEFEPHEELKERLERIKLIDRVLEEKKKVFKEETMKKNSSV